MENEIEFKWRLFLSALLGMVFIAMQSEAQTIIRQSIGSFGTSTHTEGMLLSQTVGQPYFTSGFYSGEVNIRPGFQQPSNFSLELVNSTFNLTLNVYPNPAVHSITIVSPEVIKVGQLLVLDINGRLILKETINDLKSYKMNCEEWSNGFYTITLSDSQKHRYTSNLIISK